MTDEPQYRIKYNGETEDERIFAAVQVNNLREIGDLLGDRMTQSKANTINICLNVFRELIPIGGEPESRDEPEKPAKPQPREVPPPDEPRPEKPRKVLREIPGN